jgi:hypothetical protein
MKLTVQMLRREVTIVKTLSSNYSCRDQLWTINILCGRFVDTVHILYGSAVGSVCTLYESAVDTAFSVRMCCGHCVLCTDLLWTLYALYDCLWTLAMPHYGSPVDTVYTPLWLLMDTHYAPLLITCGHSLYSCTHHLSLSCFIVLIC